MSSVVILGASGTIGSELARQLVACGTRVLLVGRDRSRLEPLASELAQPMAVVSFADSHELESALLERQEQCGGYLGLAHCVGSILLKPAHITSDAEFRDVLETNLFTAFVAVRAGVKLLRERGGSIVLFSSAAAETGLANHEAIAAAKAGIVGLARSAAATYAPQNIRVNAISPGLVRSALTRKIWENPAAEAASRELHPLGRLGEPRQVAACAAWLLAPDNDWITGQVIGLDGGLSRVQPRRTSAR